MDATHRWLDRKPPPVSIRFIFYRHGGIWVTDAWFVANGRRFAIAEIRQPRIICQPAALPEWTQLGAAAVAMGVAATVVGGLGWAAAAASLAVPATVVIGAGPRHRPMFILICDYKGVTIQLLQMRDQQRFFQIARALTRARERLGLV